jgi:hypothetical protein
MLKAGLNLSRKAFMRMYRTDQSAMVEILEYPTVVSERADARV